MTMNHDNRVAFQSLVSDMFLLRARGRRRDAEVRGGVVAIAVIVVSISLCMAVATGGSAELAAQIRSYQAKTTVDGWTPLGLSGGGAMFCPAISGADPNLMMLNCDMSAAYISTDGGRFWKMIDHRQLLSNIHCRPAMHPTNPNVIYAAYGNRIKISRDKGKTWTSFAKLHGWSWGEIRIDPDNPSLMLAGTTRGIELSRDGGRTWTSCSGPTGKAVAFHFDRTSPLTHRRLFAATREGVWRSDDSGRTWMEKDAGLTWKGIVSFAGASNAAKGVVMLYCAIPGRVVNGKYQGGVYRSRDGGEMWESAMHGGINRDIKPADQWAESPIAQYKHVLACDADPTRVYALNANTGFWPPHHTTVFRSDNSGETWRAMLYMDPRFKRYNVEPNYVTATLHQSYQPIAFGAAICPTNPDLLMLESGSVFITRDGGQTWSNGHTRLAPGQRPGPGASWLCNGLVVTTTWHYYIDPFNHNRHYICYTDIGFAISTDRGQTWRWWKRKGRAPWRNTCYELAFDPEIKGKVWGAFSNVHDIPNENIIMGRHWNNNPERGPGGVCLSTDSCETWQPLTNGLPESPVTSVVLDPKSPKGLRTLYAAVFGKGVYKSADDGKTWTNKSKGLGSKSNMRLCRIILHKDGTLFALITGMRRHGRFLKDGVGLYRSTDGAETWECITKNPVFLWPKDFTVHPDDSRILFLGVADARVGGEKQGGLYRTTDGGATWMRVARFGRQHFGAYFHPKHHDWIYATMCEGDVPSSLYLSKDGGTTWTPFNKFPFSNTQRVSVNPDNPDVIYVSTFGGSVFKGPATPSHL